MTASRKNASKKKETKELPEVIIQVYKSGQIQVKTTSKPARNFTYALITPDTEELSIRFADDGFVDPYRLLKRLKRNK